MATIDWLDVRSDSSCVTVMFVVLCELVLVCFCCLVLHLSTVFITTLTFLVDLLLVFCRILWRQLLGNTKAWKVLHNVRMAPLLPPVGAEVFRHFTPASLEEIQRQHEAEEKEQQRRKEKNIEVENILSNYQRSIK